MKSYWAALNYVLLLTEMNLAASPVVSRMFCSFKRSYPPLEMRPPNWNLSLILRWLSRPAFGLLSCRVCHSHGWKSCTFSFLPDLMAKTQNPSVPDSRFEKFSVPSLDDFVGDDRDELLLCLIWALRKNLSRTEQYRPGTEGLCVSTG